MIFSECLSTCWTSLTKWRQLILHLQHHSLPDVLQQADNLVMAKLRQVDAVHRLDVVSYIQLVAPVESRGQTINIKAGLLAAPEGPTKPEAPHKLQILCLLPVLQIFTTISALNSAVLPDHVFEGPFFKQA